ncbi:hypothetical protein SKAU_G00020150 [Synaphobranchus kaupii]|uniref:ribonuclease H n=1 Tax=Synaphobranchus kaupii TaxID=118154 RepID=A0A9Q1JEA1_SYNKA|nr:hypothetical protein SKAU_G00020150 [Synaphobranchus kaupii]
MERALLREIGEVERSISELTRRKARRAGAVTSPEWQTPAVRVSRRPDGFSGRQDNPASVSHDGTPAKPTMQLKLPHFNGTASLESYLAQLELAAQLGGWTPEQTAGHLALALEGPALEAILDLPPAERQNLQALTAALQRRFIQHCSAEASREMLLSRYHCEEESWGKVAADVQRYAHEAYPEFDAAAQEKLALHAFLRALTPERLRDHVSLAQPGSISEALIKTTRAEDTLAIRPTPQPTRQHVRVADGEEVRWTRTPLQRPVGRQGRCYRCDEPGHIARDCPAPAPKPRKHPPSGNEAGTAHPALPAPVAKIPATSAEASTSAFEKETEHKSHPRLDGQACRALVDTGATISLVRPGVLHNTGGPQLPGAWTPTATPLTSVMGAKMAMRGKKEVKVKVTVSGQEVSHEFWLADIADSCIISLDLLKRWGACVDVSRASITLGTETVALQSGPTSTPPSHHSPASKQATPASHRTQATVTDHSAPARPQCPSLTTRSPTTTSLPHSNRLPSPNQLCLPRRQQLSMPCGNEAAAGSTTSSASSSKASWTETQTCSRCGMRTVPRPSWCSTLSTPTQLNPSVCGRTGCPLPNDWWQRKRGRERELPRIDEALDHISGSSWFSSLDLRSGYWQVRLAPEAKPKTAFTIGQGLWQFWVMPFGLCNAPATFERLMERVLATVPRSRCVVYLDDLLVHASDFQQALANLTDVLAAIRQAGLRLNPKKCQLLRRERAFLGHIISEQGVATDPSKVAAVRDWPVPGNVGELRSFLGLASYYRCTIGALSGTSLPWLAPSIA